MGRAGRNLKVGLDRRATLRAPRQRPGGVTPKRPRSERGTVRAARAQRRERHPRAETAGARYRADEGTGPSGRDERDRPGAEPAGGTTTPFVRWTSGAFDSRARPMTDTTDATEQTA